VMPVMSGTEMADKILDLRPDAKVLLMTAYTDDIIRPQNSRNLPIIRKPFLPDDLLRRLRELH
jgi:CheY-like chemotaxis protein